ncbi:hypothetical protein ACFH04_41970 [Streptomyces noboritoensis]|uniref:Uncharacterized protein n=1 Tax=Streptomyces noboritoensis TaxID=67337 RepID=A0ABV6TWS3_9ACTN
MVALQAYCWTAVPSAVPADAASTHLPLCWADTVTHPVGRGAASALGR